MGMTGRKVGPADGLGLADAIGLLRDELLAWEEPELFATEVREAFKSLR